MALAAAPAFAQVPAKPPAPAGATKAAPRGQELPSKIQLQTSETFFAGMAALNVCGYDQELAASDAIRNQIRADVKRAVAASSNAQQVLGQICGFYRDHAQADVSHTISQYISLLLNTSEPPQIGTREREADLPPDAANVLGFLPLLQRFYDDAGMATIWKKYAPVYDSYVDRISVPVQQMIRNTDAYLRVPLTGYTGRGYALVIEPLVAPGQINARNYGFDFYLVLAPQNGTLEPDSRQMAAVRHTYLHFVLEPVAMKRMQRLRRMDALLETVVDAPLEQTFKSDITLLASESFIRAVEARTMTFPRDAGLDRKTVQRDADSKRSAAVEAAMQQGFVLTRYFYDRLEGFEKGQAGIDQAFGDMVYDLGPGLDREIKRASSITFARQAAPEILAESRTIKVTGLDEAVAKLGAGDANGAAEIARRVLETNSDDAARATFILAQAASMSGHMQEAIEYFQSALQIAHDPRMVAWSHIYLARIFDIRQEREQALRHYNAALNAGDVGPDARDAAERGLQRPFQPPARSTPPPQQPLPTKGQPGNPAAPEPKDKN